MSRPVSATVTDYSGTPREALPIYFHAPDGYADVVAPTDASGVFVAHLETGITYRVAVENAVIVDGLTFPAGTVFVVRVTEGEGPVPAIEAMQGTLDASRPTLLDAIAALTARVDALEALHAPEPPEEP
jgi:hypothetical protein